MYLRNSVVLLVVLLTDCLARPVNAVHEIEEPHTGMFWLTVQSRHGLCLSQNMKRIAYLSRKYLRRALQRALGIQVLKVQYLILTNFRSYLLLRKFVSCISRVLNFRDSRKKVYTSVFNLISRFCHCFSLPNPGSQKENFHKLTGHSEGTWKLYVGGRVLVQTRKSFNKERLPASPWLTTSKNSSIVFFYNMVLNFACLLFAHSFFASINFRNSSRS